MFVAVEGRTIGAILLADELRRDTPRAIQALCTAGVRRIVMVNGDRAEAAEPSRQRLISTRLPTASPPTKSTRWRRSSTRPQWSATASMIHRRWRRPMSGSLWVRAAQAPSSQAADVVILVERLDRASDVLTIAKRTYAIAMQSIIAGMALSALAMAFAAAGYLPPIAGAVAQADDRCRHRHPQRFARLDPWPQSARTQNAALGRHGPAPRSRTRRHFVIDRHMSLASDQAGVGRTLRDELL